MRCAVVVDDVAVAVVVVVVSGVVVVVVVVAGWEKKFAGVVVGERDWLLAVCWPPLTGIRLRPAADAATAALIGRAGEKEVGEEVAALVRAKKLLALLLSGPDPGVARRPLDDDADDDDSAWVLVVVAAAAADSTVVNPRLLLLAGVDEPARSSRVVLCAVVVTGTKDDEP